MGCWIIVPLYASFLRWPSGRRSFAGGGGGKPILGKNILDPIRAVAVSGGRGEERREREPVGFVRLGRSRSRMAPTSRYWVVSLPVQTSQSVQWARLQEAISKNAFDTPLYRVSCSPRVRQDALFRFDPSFFFSTFVWCNSIPQFNAPDLRVGTLDSLLSLSDDLVKVWISPEFGLKDGLSLYFLLIDVRFWFCEKFISPTTSLRASHRRSGGKSRSWRELLAQRVGCLRWTGSLWTPTWQGALDIVLGYKVCFFMFGIPVVFSQWRTWNCRFVWDEARYPTMSPLREIVDNIHSQVSKIEDDMKVIYSSIFEKLKCRWNWIFFIGNTEKEKVFPASDTNISVEVYRHYSLGNRRFMH